MGVTQSEPEASEMAQKLVVRPIERIPAYTVDAQKLASKQNY